MDSIKVSLCKYLPLGYVPDGWQRYSGLAVGVCAAFASTVIARRIYQRRGLPPGPKSGLFGLSDKVKLERFEHDLDKLSKLYGDIFCVQVGSSLIVCLASQPIIKEAFVQNGDTFANRGRDMESMRRILDFKDDVFSRPYESEGFNKTRTAIMSCLRGAGFGQSKGTEEKILNELENIFSYLIPLRKHQRAVNLRNILPKLSVNIIFQTLFSISYDYEDKQLQERLDLLRLFFSTAGEAQDLSIVSRFIAELFYRKEMARSRQTTDTIRAIVRDEVKRHIADFDADNPRDFVDNYLLKFGPDDFDIDRLVDNTLTFMPDASDTISITLDWVLLYLAVYRTVQRHVAEELLALTNGNRPIKWADKSQLPFTEATILEAIRLATPVRVTLSHAVKKDTIFHGYRIPRSAAIYGLLYTAHRDPRIYKDPEAFNPDRFINKDGNIVKSDAWIPFSMGRRKCIGENLAQMEIFMVISNFVQKYEFKLPDGAQPDFDACLNHFLNRRPEEYSLILDDRMPT